MEKWLESARAALRAHGAVPTDMEQLEDAIQVKNLLLNMSLRNFLCCTFVRKESHFRT